MPTTSSVWPSTVFDENGEVVVPDCVRGALRPLVGQIDALDEAIRAIDKELAASVKSDETAKRLTTIPRHDC
jgi:transposase